MGLAAGEYATRGPQFLATALPGLDPETVRFVPHHVAHAASAGLAQPDADRIDSAVLVLDGRGEFASHLAGVYRDGALYPLYSQPLPHSLGLLYEERPPPGFPALQRRVQGDGVGRLRAPQTPGSVPGPRPHHRRRWFRAGPVEWDALAKARRSGDEIPNSTPTSPPVCRRDWRRCCWS